MGGQEGGTGWRKGEPGKAVQAGKRGKRLNHAVNEFLGLRDDVGGESDVLQLPVTNRRRQQSCVHLKSVETSFRI